jgi:thiamine-phosphate pyrophosphorylase
VRTNIPSPADAATNVMRGLYAIIDADFLENVGIPLIPFAERVILAKPAVVQLRAKSQGTRDTLGWLRALRPLCAAAGVPLFANDRPDLAVLAGCDGVHVGQEDLGVEEIRRFAPSLRVGVSTHDEDQLRSALALGPDYVAYGPVFPTASKERPSPVVGIAALAAAGRLSRGAGIPLVAIGGIDAERASEIRTHASLGAVIRAMFPDDGMAGVEKRVTNLHRALGGK